MKTALGAVRSCKTKASAWSEANEGATVEANCGFSRLEKVDVVVVTVVTVVVAAREDETGRAVRFSKTDQTKSKINILLTTNKPQ